MLSGEPEKSLKEKNYKSKTSYLPVSKNNNIYMVSSQFDTNGEEGKIQYELMCPYTDDEWNVKSILE